MMRLKTYRRAVARYAEAHGLREEEVRKHAKHRMAAQREWYEQ